MKTETPREIAASITQYIVLTTGVAGVVFTALFTEGIWPWVALVLLLVFIGMVSNRLINWMIERYISRRIKLIYKTIHRLKTNRFPSEDLDYATDVIGNVNKEVLEWAKSNREEIAMLKEQANFRKEFIGNLAHELRTPAFNVQGYLLTLLEGGLEDPKINREYLERADRNLDRLINLINDLDKISKIELKAEEMEYSDFDVVKLAKEVVESHKYMADEAGINLVVKPVKKELVVHADRDRIEQVLVNLLVNSIRYGKKDGETKIKCYEMDDQVLIEVEDNGIGIDNKHIPRLFERFYRVDKSRSRNLGGSGLGLAIVKHIIDAHNQTINVRSQVNEGTVFSFTLAKSGKK